MQRVCDVLEELTAEGILGNYAIGGATAAGFHGEPLATMDVDVFVFLEGGKHALLVSLEPLFRNLKDKGFESFEEEALMIHGLPVQFLTASGALEEEALTEAMIVEWEGHRMRVMRPEHLAAIALTVGRPKDRARVVYLVSLDNFDKVRFQEILSRHGLTDRWTEWSAALGVVESQ
jgi:hypothetical protein